MATNIRARDASGLYQEDFYVWVEVQTELLRARRFDSLDLERLIEEVEELGGALRRSVLNNAAVVVEHLLKLQFSPAIEPRNGWRASVREHRRRLRIDLTARLRQILEDELEMVYTLARNDAASVLRDHGEDDASAALPAACPYDVDRIIGDWWP